ncbi:MAG: 4Fe-4S binding protein [Candidatus Helarchaeota archaeon]
MKNEEYYELLAKKLDKSVVALADRDTQKISRTWMEYLRVLVPLDLVKYLIELDLNPKFMSIKRFAKKINKTIEEAAEILETLFDNDCVMKTGSSPNFKYAINLPNTMVSAPPLSLNRYSKEKAENIAKLSYKFIVEERWFRNYEGAPETPLFRVIPVEKAVEVSQQILAYDNVIELIDKAEIISIQECACRARLEFLGIRKCNYPMETCIGLNHGAKYYIDRGLAREISKEEAKEKLKEFNKIGLLHLTENYQDEPHGWICNCCECCCVVCAGLTQWGNPSAVAAANYVASINSDICEQCETCVELCKFKAIQLDDTGPKIDENLCMGCGVCVVNCPVSAINLKRVDREYICKDQFELGLKILQETDREI